MVRYGLLLGLLAPAASFPLTYDCKDGMSSRWSDRKRSTCCLVAGLGCEEQVNPSSSNSEEYDCEQGLGTWRRTWSPAKRNWCCTHKFSCESTVDDNAAPAQASPPTPRPAAATPPPTTPAPTPPPRPHYQVMSGPCVNGRFTPPAAPMHATDLNGVKLQDTCFHTDGEHHVFIIGDWGGIGSPPKPADHRTANFMHHRAFVQGVDDTAQIRVAHQMAKRALSHAPDYVLNVGDNFYWGGIDEMCGTPPFQCQDSTGQWHWAYETVYQGPGLDGKQWLGVLGNHDYGGFTFTKGWDRVIGYTWDHTAVSTGRWMTPAQYWSSTVRYPDVSVDYFFVDSNVFNAFHPDSDEAHNMCSRQHNAVTTCGAQGPTSLDECPKWFAKLWQDQVQWLDEVLPKSRADWQIVVTHFPPIHGQQDWVRLAAQHGIDMIVTGHIHNQQVHYSDPGNFLAPTAYIISGGGGGITSEGLPDPEGNDDQYGFMHMTVSRTELKVEAISHGGMLRSTTRVHQRHAASGRRLDTAEVDPGAAAEATPLNI